MVAVLIIQNPILKVTYFSDIPYGNTLYHLLKSSKITTNTGKAEKNVKGHVQIPQKLEFHEKGASLLSETFLWG